MFVYRFINRNQQVEETTGGTIQEIVNVATQLAHQQLGHPIDIQNPSGEKIMDEQDIIRCIKHRCLIINIESSPIEDRKDDPVGSDNSEEQNNLLP